MKKIAIFFGIAVLTVIAVMAFKTFTNNPGKIAVEQVTMSPLDKGTAVGRLAEAVRIRTISHSTDDPAPAAELDRLHVLINSSYPLVAKKLKREVVGGHSLLYTWQGSDPRMSRMYYRQRN